MDWNAPYVVTRALNLEISPRGRLVVSRSLTTPASEVPLDAVAVLLRFARATPPHAAWASLCEEWEVGEAEFASAVERLLEARLLLPAGGAAGRAAADRSLAASPRLTYHHALLNDAVRVLAYQAAIARRCRGKVVVEIGCGSGILSIFAAKAGATRVYAIEETEIADLAARMFAANGCDGIVELVRGNSRDIEVPERADLLLHEIFGSDPFDENVLPSLADARRRFLKPGGALLPHRLEVLCVGVEVPLRQDQERAIAEARELGGLYGIDVGPLLDTLAEAEPGLFQRPGAVVDEGFGFRPAVLSEECRLADLDLAVDAPDLVGQIAGQLAGASLRIVRSGTLSGVALFFRTHLDDQTVLSTSPFAPITTWGRRVTQLSSRLEVRPGDVVPLATRFETQLGKQTLTIDLAPDARGQAAPGSKAA